jgi:hypothetical protein
MRRQVTSAVPTIRAGDDELRLWLGVGDRGADQLSERGHPGLDVSRQPSVACGGDHDAHRWLSSLMGAPTKERILAADAAADTGAVLLP